jgi:hypothetical protein
MENITDRLENRWPFSNTCTSQSADTSKSGIGRLEGDRSMGAIGWMSIVTPAFE